MRHAQPRAGPGHRRAFRRRLWPQAVIDRRHLDPQPDRHRQMQQRDRIPAPRNRQPQSIRARRRHSGIPQALTEDIDDVPGQEQPSPCIAVMASPASTEPGKRVPTSCNVTQASGVCPSAPSDVPSFSRDAPAFGPDG